MESVVADAASTDGARDAAAPKRSLARRPEVVVLGIAVLMFAGVFVGGLFTSSPSSSPRTPAFVPSVAVPGGGSVAFVHAGALLAPMASGGIPPADVLGALELPAGTVRVGPPEVASTSSGYDETLRFTTTVSADQLSAAYAALLPKLGWQLAGSGPDPYHAGSTEVLGKRAGSDGSYWESGVVVSPMTPAGLTPFSLRLFQVDSSS